MTADGQTEAREAPPFLYFLIVTNEFGSSEIGLSMDICWTLNTNLQVRTATITLKNVCRTGYKPSVVMHLLESHARTRLVRDNHSQQYIFRT